MLPNAAMYSEIFNYINTKFDLDMLNFEVGILRESIFKQGEGSFENVLITKVRPVVSAAVQKELKDQNIKVDEYLNGLKKEIKKFELVTITLAYEPTNATFNNLGSWVRKNTFGLTVIDINYDPSIVAGAIIVFKGKYVDYSIRTQIKSLFESKKYERILI